MLEESPFPKESHLHTTRTWHPFLFAEVQACLQTRRTHRQVLWIHWNKGRFLAAWPTRLLPHEGFTVHSAPHSAISSSTRSPSSPATGEDPAREAAVHSRLLLEAMGGWEEEEKDPPPTHPSWRILCPKRQDSLLEFKAFLTLLADLRVLQVGRETKSISCGNKSHPWRKDTLCCWQNWYLKIAKLSWGLARMRVSPKVGILLFYWICISAPWLFSL